MTIDPNFWPDLVAFIPFVILAIVGELIWRRMVGRLPPQQPGDASGLARGLTTISCAGVIVVALACIGGFIMLVLFRE